MGLAIKENSKVSRNLCSIWRRCLKSPKNVTYPPCCRPNETFLKRSLKGSKGSRGERNSIKSNLNKQVKSLLKVRAGRDAGQAASGRNRSGQTKIKMPNTFDTFQTPNGKFNGCFGMRWVGGGGGGEKGFFFKKIPPQKPLVESKGIFQTRSDLSCQPTK